MSECHPLDGHYQITSVSDYDGPLQKQSDGETHIRDSKTHRIDDAGCKWSSHFQILNDHEVKMTSHADPSQASADFLLTAQDGTPTSEAVTYEAILSLKQQGDKIMMSGSINYGRETVVLTLRKIGA